MKVLQIRHWAKIVSQCKLKFQISNSFAAREINSASNHRFTSLIHVSNINHFRNFSTNSSQQQGLEKSVSSETNANAHSEEENSEPGEMVKMTFVTPKGERIEVEGEVGKSVMDVGLDNEVGMEGACGGVLACTTCHVHVDDDTFDNVIGPPTDRIEDDMLDMADFLKPNSRLSCQIKVSKEIEGASFSLPQGTKNYAVDGFVPKKH